MTLFGTAQDANPKLGGRAFRSRGVAAPVGATWWNPLNSAAITARATAGGLWAWRAQAVDNVTYGPGPANYAASLISVEGNAVVLGEIGGSVNWGALMGWSGFFGLGRALDTTIVTQGTGWAMFCQYTNNAGNSSVICGAQSGGNTRWFIYPRIVLNDILYCSGNFGIVAPTLVSGNLAVLAQQGYKNSVSDGIPIGAWGGVNTRSTYIGGLNSNGVLAFDCTGEIQALLLCDDATAFTAPDITAIAASPGGSMFNL